MVKRIKLAFFRGLITLIPVVGTVYFLSWIILQTESLADWAFGHFFAPYFYFPGLGTVLMFAAIVLLGFLVSNYFTSQFIAFISKTLEEFPLIKIIYKPLKDLMQLFSGGKSKKMQRVVLVQWPDQAHRALGIVMREDFSDITGSSKIPKGYLAVWLPNSYMIGGPTIIVQRELTEEIDISPETAMKLAVTGWLT